MYESPKEYKKIVKHQVAVLQDSCRCLIRDGEVGRCPRCGLPGVWDIANIGLHLGYGNSIYYSTVFYDWRCTICEMQRASRMV